MFYDAKFGRKKESAAEDAAENGRAVYNGNSLTMTSNGNGHVKKTSDLSIYEQYSQVFL